MPGHSFGSEFRSSLPADGELNAATRRIVDEMIALGHDRLAGIAREQQPIVFPNGVQGFSYDIPPKNARLYVLYQLIDGEIFFVRVCEWKEYPPLPRPRRRC